MRSYSAIELALVSKGFREIAGLDEAGRGPLAGPVVAAAVIFDTDSEIEGIADSKKLSPDERNRLADMIRERAVAFGIGITGHKEIDAINILQASILAMHRAVEALPVVPGYLIVDGNRFHHPHLPFETVVKGDGKCFSIAAASILAKVTRDRIMCDLHETYPVYGFDRHKGYPTPEHIRAIKMHGPSPIHRTSFVVKQLVQIEAFETP